MPLRLLLHIGPHKTGTTTLQHAFDSMRYLLMRAGIYYPKGLHRSGAHHALAWQLLARPLGWLEVEQDAIEHPEARLNRWVKEATALGSHTLFLSAEDFSLFDNTMWHQLGDGLRRSGNVDRIDLVFLRRDPIDMARSSYGTLVMFGETRRFDEIEAALIGRFERNLALASGTDDGAALIDNRIGLDFESLSKSNQLVSNFSSEVLGIVPPLTTWSRLNESFAPEIIEKIRQWNEENCPYLTIDDDTGDFNPAAFSSSAELHQRRIEYVNQVMTRV